jgi:hypothetical protein
MMLMLDTQIVIGRLSMPRSFGRRGGNGSPMPASYMSTRYRFGRSA